MHYQKQQILHISIKIVFTSFYIYIVDSNIFDFALQYFILPPLRLIIEVMRLSMDRIVLFITSTGILLIVLITLSSNCLYDSNCIPSSKASSLYFFDTKRKIFSIRFMSGLLAGINSKTAFARDIALFARALFCDGSSSWTHNLYIFHQCCLYAEILNQSHCQ